MAALKAMTAPMVHVRRGGGTQDLPAAQLVPGDLVLLGPGDLLAADLRLTESWALRVNEAALTGESTPATKQIEPLPEIDDSLLAERRNMAFRGTAATGGHGAGVMVATGMATELGRLAELLQRHPAEPTPLQRRPSSLCSSRSGASAGGPEGPAVYLPDGPAASPPIRAGYCWAGGMRPSSGGDVRDRDHGGTDHARAVAGDGERDHDTRRRPAGSRHAGRDDASPS
jgi:E1-E2 ATPase